MSAARRAAIQRETAETQITLSLDLDGSGTSKIETGIGFLDHMLTLFAKHGNFDLEVKAVGDLHIDCHHTVEDTGIVLGQAVRQALGDKKGIVRYGHAYVPMDETLGRVVIDLSGRSFIEHRVPAVADQIVNGFPFQLIEEFMRAFAHNALCNLHTEILYGRDSHHMAESLFKGLARALDTATRIDPRVTGVPSTKAVL